jgi:perosamine synthetase
MKLLGVGEGDEVIVPTMTFVSTAHAVVYNGGIPVFVDCDYDSLNINLDDLEKKITSRTKAIIVVHYGGYPVDMDRVLTIAKDIPVIEDSAHACGSSYKDRMCGSIGLMGCFSFHAVKNLAIGDGGCLVTDNCELFERAKKLRWLGIDKGTWDRVDGDKSYWWKYDVCEVGLKCHMNDIMAAMALVQLGKLNDANQKRFDVACRYFEGLCGIDEIDLPPHNGNGFKSSWHIFHIKAKNRDDLSLHLKKCGINTGVHYMPIHLYDCYGTNIKIPIAESLMSNILSLPMHPCLSDGDVSRIIESIIGFYKC